jgi:hypothetical protein
MFPSSTHTRSSGVIMEPETRLVSFMLRFVYEEIPDGAESPAAGWIGVIRTAVPA